MASDRGGSADGRARILDAAQDLFAQRGFAATSIKAIAGQAEVATGLLYYHFGSKDDLMATLVDERSLALGVEDAIADPGDDEPGKVLERAVRALLDAFEARHDMARILLQEAAAGDHKDRLQHLLGSVLDELVGYLRGATRAGQARAEFAARTLISSVLVGAVVWPHPDRDQLVQGTVDMVLAAVA